MGMSHLLQGECAQARGFFERLKEDEARSFYMALLKIRQDPAREADALLAAYTKDHGKQNPCDVATLYATRGLTDPALVWLQRAIEKKKKGIAGTKVDPLLNSLHADPRFAVLLETAGFED